MTEEEIIEGKLRAKIEKYADKEWDACCSINNWKIAFNDARKLLDNIKEFNDKELTNILTKAQELITQNIDFLTEEHARLKAKRKKLEIILSAFEDEDEDEEEEGSNGQ